MNQALKNAIDYLFDICDPNAKRVVSERTITIEREQLRTEFLDFISYLSASDGIIATFEADFLKTYFDIVISAEELRKHIDKKNTYSAEFEQKTPQTLIDLVAYDNAVFSHSGALKFSYSKAYCHVFESVAKEFIVCDGEASDTEVSDMTIYLTALNEYRGKYYTGPSNADSAVSVHEIHAGENVPRYDENGELEKSLDDLLNELNGLIGLDAVKKDVNSLIHLQEIKRLRKARGLKEIPVSNHLVFYGNPGTGKTTVARLLAKIYYAMGILSQGQLIEVDRSGLVAGYVGQTALKVQEVVKSALGGVLFIDEAYALTYSQNGNDYGQEAVDTLLKAMEDNRDDFIVIVAGYPELMAQFVESNPGLRSRFNKYINFEDYTVPELIEIFKVMCNNAGYFSTEEVLQHVTAVFEEKYAKRTENFANAREVRNFFESAILNQADRLFGIKNPSNEQLCTLIIDDVKSMQ